MTDKDPIGFFWCGKGGTYNVVILHKARKIKVGKAMKSFSWEHEAPTPESLVETCAYGDGEFGYDIGTPEEVKFLCESAPVSRGRIKQRSKKRGPT